MCIIIIVYYISPPCATHTMRSDEHFQYVERIEINTTVSPANRKRYHPHHSITFPLYASLVYSLTSFVKITRLYGGKLS